MYTSMLEIFRWYCWSVGRSNVKMRPSKGHRQCFSCVWTYLPLHFHTWRKSEKIIRCDERPERYPNMGTSFQHSTFRKIYWSFFLGKGTIRSMQLQKQMCIERKMHFTSVYLPWSWLPTWCITKVGIYNILKYLLLSSPKQIWSFPHNFNVKYICTHAWRHMVYIICKGYQPRAPSFLFKSIIKPPYRFGI